MERCFWGALVTLFSVSIYSVIKIGNNRANIIIVIFSAIGICLLRSNGWIVFLISVFVFILLFGKARKGWITVFIVVLMVSYILKYPVLDALNVKQPDTIEALSIPAQQIARVVVEEKELTDEQRVLLNNIVDVEKIPEVYSSYISDPIKNLIREKSNQEYLRRHKSAFINLYIHLGLKYPIEYIQAWVDQTRGYWNAGYSYWRWTTGVADNEFGITRIIFSERMDSLRKEYMNLWEKSLILQIFLCIGVYVWIILILTCRTVIKKNREAFF